MPITTPQGTLDFKKVDRVTFVGASSNTVIDTTTGSLGVGVDGNGPMSKLHVVGNTRLEGDINMLHTSNTASIKLNSNVVAEFPRSKKLIKYPRVALTSASQGGYVVGRSTTYQNSAAIEAWKMFDEDASTYWHSENSTGYWNTDGTYDGSSELITGHLGEFVTLQLPANEKVQLHRIHVFPRGLKGESGGWSAGAAPKDVVVIGSDNGSSWNVIATTTLTNYSFGTNPQISTPVGEEFIPATFDFQTNKYYRHVGLIIKSLYPGGHVHAGVSSLEFFGTPEYDPEAHGTDVVVKSVANVPNTDWLEVYYDGQDYTEASDFTAVNGVLDKAGADNHGSQTGGVGFDTEYKAFTFDGSTTQHIRGTMPTTVVHTVGCWFKMLDTGANHVIFAAGDAVSRQTTGFFIDSSSKLRVYFFNNDFILPTITTNTWYHICYSYSGGVLSHSTVKTYLNGTEITGTRSASSEGSLELTNFNFSINGDNDGDYIGEPSHVANLRLYSKALTSDEIYQLYAYQKEYFGHGDLSMTLKAGRLGIGTSEPRAALDVRGDLNVSSFIKYDSAWFYAYDGDTVGTTSFDNYTGFVPFNKLKPGSKYFTPTNTSTGGYYTAPVDGIYHFETSVLSFPGPMTGISSIWFSVNGTTGEDESYGYNRKHNIPTQNGLDASSTFRINKGDIVKVRVSNIDCFTDAYLGIFSGFLVTRI
jgi:hypothetical protein